jgi:hypothetical protein
MVASLRLLALSFMLLIGVFEGRLQLAGAEADSKALARRGKWLYTSGGYKKLITDWSRKIA